MRTRRTGTRRPGTPRQRGTVGPEVDPPATPGQADAQSVRGRGGSGAHGGPAVVVVEDLNVVPSSLGQPIRAVLGHAHPVAPTRSIEPEGSVGDDLEGFRGRG